MTAPLITDVFGKASVDTNYAPATTVTATRTVSGSVLTCFDLSKYAPDTPVYVLTYKKVADPTTGVVSVINQTSAKAIVNVGSNTLTNFTVAPGYTDIGNDIGDYVECIPTSYWVNDLIKGILSFANPDATLKKTAVQAALNLATTSSDWNTLGTAPTLVATNGNRSFDIKYPGVNFTDRLSRGTRLLIPRTGSTPTQSADFNGTNQYINKVSPSGITFTTQFTCEAWVYLDSYGAGLSTVLSRLSAGNGFVFGLAADGRIRLYAKNSALTLDTAYSSAVVPLGRHVHIAATMDLGASAATFYIDGVATTTNTYNNGTTTSITQGGDLAIGSESGGANYTDGRISDVRVWSTIRTNQQIKDNMNQPLVGTESGLVGYWPLNGDLNDKTANANNMTAVNGTAPNYADNPFNSNAYAIIQATPVYNGTDTTATVVTPTGHPIPNATLGTSSYSSMKAPYGMPLSPVRWEVVAYALPGWSMAAPASGSFEDVLSFVLSTGQWNVDMMGHDTLQRSTAGQVSGAVRLYNANYDYLQDSLFTNASVTNHQRAVYRADTFDLASPATFTLQVSGASGLSAVILESKPTFRCRAIPAYL